MKKSRIFAAWAAIALMVTSCYKDMGNYDYIELEDFQVEELNKFYSVISFQENLEIIPEIKAETNDFEYRWFISYMGTDSKQKVDTLSKEKILDVPFDYKTGKYPLYLKVKSLKTGISKYVETEVRATTPFLDGFYIMKETAEGNTEVDLHFPNGKTFYDVITKYHEAPLKGKPKSFSYMPFFSYLDTEKGQNVIDDLLIPASEQERISIRLSDMKVARENKDWFFNSYPIEKIRFSLPMWAGAIMVTEDGVHQNYQLPAYGMLSSGMFSDIPNRTEDIEADFYEVSSNVVVLQGKDKYTSTFFYNSRDNQFINVDYNSSPKHCTMMNGKKKEKIEGKVLNLAGTSMDGLRLFVICEKGDGNRYCYFADANDYVTLPILSISEFKDIPEFNRAEMYVGCRKGGNMLYSLYNNEVYAFSPDSEKSQKVIFTGLPEGKIVYMDTMYFILGEDKDSSFNYMLVGVENGGKYSLAMYDMVGGLPVKGEKPAKVLEGEGKISSVQYVNALKNVNTQGEWSINY